MSRALTVEAGGKKGAVQRTLSIAVAGKLVAAREEGLPEELLRVMDTAKAAAQKLIHLAHGGSEIMATISVQEDPIRGWNVSVLVDVTDR